MLSRRISLHSTRLRSVCFALLILLIPHSLFAYEVSNDFDTYDSSVETTLVWRYNLGELSTPLQIKDYVTNTSSTLSVNFSVGNGEDGIFDSSTYADFSEGGDVSGNTITINTDTFSTLQFTSFHLDSGWTIRPTGENPRSIYALGSVTIEGVIACSGGEGEGVVDGGGSYSTGGVGVCGGGDGGSGASTISGEVAADGEFLGETVPGGGAGGVDGPTAGVAATGQPSGSAGGGGGAYTQTGASR
ncbi:MAG: hypothetical protein HRT45_02495, partial [Bdellovibrionales bacterium]|nr:hypothetical protein [Bdellovibrionales bacterium]